MPAANHTSTGSIRIRAPPSIMATTRSPDLREREAEIERIRIEKENAIKEQRFEEAADLRDQERKLKEERKWIQYWRDHQNENPAMTEAFKDNLR